MSTLTKSTAGTRRITNSRDSSWSAFLELTKPRISTMVLITVVVAAVFGQPDLARLARRFQRSDFDRVDRRQR